MQRCVMRAILPPPTPLTGFTHGFFFCIWNIPCRVYTESRPSRRSSSSRSTSMVANDAPRRRLRVKTNMAAAASASTPRRRLRATKTASALTGKIDEATAQGAKTPRKQSALMVPIDEEMLAAARDVVESRAKTSVLLGWCFISGKWAFHDDCEKFSSWLSTFASHYRLHVSKHKDFCCSRQ
jgi:hypothetical protein